MKKVKLALVALIIAAGTFGVFAFSDANETTAETDTATTTLHWFDVDGTYLGLDTKTNIQSSHCGPTGPNPCAEGYEEIDDSGSEPQPVDPIVDTADRQ